VHSTRTIEINFNPPQKSGVVNSQGIIMARARITDKDLDNLCDQINKATKSPMLSYSYTGANPGCYFISHAYGGVQLQRISNTGGGVTTPLGGGYVTKRELYEKLSAYLAGLTDED
jgi:hypothetical protein